MRLGNKKTDVALHSVGVYWVVATTFVIMAVCLGVPLSIRNNRNDLAEDQRVKDEQASVFEMRLRLRTGYQTVFSSVVSLESFVLGAMRTLPNNTERNATLRTQGQSFSGFDAFALAHQEYINGFMSLQLQPGGVIHQVFPANSAPVGLDLLYANTTLSPSLLANILDGSQIYVDGPRLFVQGGFGIIMRKLVYTLNSTERSLDTWWGTVAVLVNWESFLNASGVTTVSGVDLIIYDTATRTILYSAGTATTNSSSAMFDIIGSWRGSCAEVALPQNKSWTVCVALPDPLDYFTEDEVFAVVFVGIFGPSLLAMVILLVLWYQSLEYDGREHAPKVAPVVYTRIGIFRVDKLWDVNQMLMERIRDDFSRIVHESCEEVRGYLAEEMLGSCAVATRSVDAGIHFGYLVFEAIGKCQDQWAREGILSQHDDASPLLSFSTSPRNDEIGSIRLPSRHAGGIASMPATSEEASSCFRIKLQCVVHLCQEVTVDVDRVNSSLVYEGADILHSLKLFGLVHPNLVCLTHVTARVARTVKDVELVNLAPIAFRGNDSFVLFMAAVDKCNRQVWQSSLDDAQRLVSKVSLDTSINVANPLLRRRKSDLSTGGLASPQEGRRLLLPDVQVDVSGRQGGGAMPTALPAVGAYWTNWGTISKHVTPNSQATMKKVFEYQNFQSSDVFKYESLKGVFAAFYLAFFTMFRPFADVERRNIYRRLVTLFGVPPAGGDVVEHLAVRCVLIVLNRQRQQEDCEGDDQRSLTTLNRSDSDLEETD